MAVLNLCVLLVYARFEGRTPGHEWTLKWRSFLAFNQSHRLNSVLVGDSSAEWGFDIAQVDRDGFNLGRAGLEPSRLPSLSGQIIALAQRPRYVFCSISSIGMADNAWTKPWELPFGLTISDALRLFYDDQNSLRPVIWGGSGAVTRLARRAVDTIPAAGFAVDTPVADIKFRIYRSNFALVQKFSGQLRRAGIHVVWIKMPYRQDFVEALAGPGASYADYEKNQLRGIFGSDIVDLRDVLDDTNMADCVHVTPRGRAILSEALNQRIRSQFKDFDPPRHL